MNMSNESIVELRSSSSDKLLVHLERGVNQIQTILGELIKLSLIFCEGHAALLQIHKVSIELRLARFGHPFDQKGLPKAR